jgi:hypothetical protein
LKGGRSAFVYTLLEHKSTVDPITPIQIGTYAMRIWRRHGAGADGSFRSLPPIIPIVFHHGPRRWNIPTSITDCLDADDAVKDQVRDLRYTVHSLGERPDRDLSDRPEVRAVLLALKHFHEEPASFELLVRILSLPSEDKLLLTQLIHYILYTQPAIDKEAWGRLASAARPGREDELMSIAIREWKAEGRAEGKAEGKAEGFAASIIKLVELRFRQLEPAEREWLTRLPAEQLEPMVDRALTAPTLDAVFRSPTEF